MSASSSVYGFVQQAFSTSWPQSSCQVSILAAALSTCSLCSMLGSCWLVHKEIARCLLPASLATCWLPFTSLPLTCSPAGISALLSWCLGSPAECQVVSFHPSHLSYISFLNAWLCFFFFFLLFDCKFSLYMYIHMYTLRYKCKKYKHTCSNIFSAPLAAYSLPRIAWIYVKQQVPFKIPAAHWHYQWCQFVSASTVIVAEKASFAVRFSKVHDFFPHKSFGSNALSNCGSLILSRIQKAFLGFFHSVPLGRGFSYKHSCLERKLKQTRTDPTEQTEKLPFLFF